MSTLLIKNAALVATFDAQSRRIEHCDIFVKDNRIAQIGQSLKVEKPDRVIDATDMLVMPGLINCHHHLFQTLTRCVPRVQEAELFPWLVHLYEIWRELSPDALYWGCMTGLGELLLTGCTTTTDHTYLHTASAPFLFDEEIKAAKTLGIRFQPTRGSMSMGKDKGGLPPNDVVQTEEEILRDCQRVIEKYHDPDPLAMIKVALAPCSPFSVTPELLRESAILARKHGLRCHTHLAETQDEDAFCLEKFGKRPYDLMESLGWVGPDIWYAHAVYLNSDEVKRAAETGTCVSHCPASNMMLHSGIAPIPEMVANGVGVGLGVDGSASNDSSDMLGEVRNCWLLHRLNSGVEVMNPELALRLGTEGGARVLGYKDLGRLEVGMGADIIGIPLRRLGYAGAMSDPVAAVVMCGDTHIVDFNVVNGQVAVEHGHLVHADENEIWEQANHYSRLMLEKAKQRTGVDFCSKEGPGLVAPRPSKDK